jgi:hypothetical protein
MPAFYLVQVVKIIKTNDFQKKTVEFFTVFFYALLFN